MGHEAGIWVSGPGFEPSWWGGGRPDGRTMEKIPPCVWKHRSSTPSGPLSCFPFNFKHYLLRQGTGTADHLTLLQLSFHGLNSSWFMKANWPAVDNILEKCVNSHLSANEEVFQVDDSSFRAVRSCPGPINDNRLEIGSKWDSDLWTIQKTFCMSETTV